MMDKKYVYEINRQYKFMEMKNDCDTYPVKVRCNEIINELTFEQRATLLHNIRKRSGRRK